METFILTIHDETAKREILSFLKKFEPQAVELKLEKPQQEVTRDVKKRSLGLLEGKGHFEIKNGFKMSDEELLLS